MIPRQMLQSNYWEQLPAESTFFGSVLNIIVISMSIAKAKQEHQETVISATVFINTRMCWHVLWRLPLRERVRGHRSAEGLASSWSRDEVSEVQKGES